MTNTDPLTDFSTLISQQILITSQNSLQTPSQSDEYLKELQLNNFQTRQLFDELLQEEESPIFSSQLEKNQLSMNQQILNFVTDPPHMTYIEVRKTRKIFKQKKTPSSSTHQSVHFGLIPREKQNQASKMVHNRQRFRIQQNDQQQKHIQTTRLKRKNKDKNDQTQVQVSTRNKNQSSQELSSLGKPFNCEQFQNYLSLS